MPSSRTDLFHVEAGPHIHDHPLRVCKLPRNIERSCQRYKDGPVYQDISVARSAARILFGQIPEIYDETPSLMDMTHSRNLACAARSLEKDVVRCSSSSSSCFFTELSCCTDSVARSTVKGLSINLRKTAKASSISSTDLADQAVRPCFRCLSMTLLDTVLLLTLLHGEFS